VDDQLGPLGSSGDEALSDLRATALSYLESGNSLVRTAAALHIHRNTVLYRLGSIERMLGRTLGERPLATYAALALAQQVGGSLDLDHTTETVSGPPLEDITYL
jgi:DNA-binding PucR family transcriptional regulator